MEKRRKGKRREGWRIEAVRKRKMDVETIFTTFDESEGARRASLPPPPTPYRGSERHIREKEAGGGGYTISTIRSPYARQWWWWCWAVLCMVAPYHQRLRRGIIHHLYDTHLHFHISYLHFPSPSSLSLSLCVSFLF
jgi:hypothetical protein